MTRQQHASYLKQLDTMLVTEFNATKRITDNPGYTVETKYGSLALYPDVLHLDRVYSPDVYGRFTGNGPWHSGANPHSGKWNMHLSDECDAATALDHLRYRLSQVLPVAVA